ncbi:YhfG family protein [Pseudoduganella violacea]|uniref:DUF2559 family protein n=1 Tax=Pseudoduganella violacea TaxID=1715466 RepID=A0A7W5B643_9BURK|nr:YhfG family protein [Pseudoduganella violacea]MBB3117234.1 hypothetical protein [Pseudoduganella violacea]
MLTTEMKRQIFLRLRDENYQASLRLEGLVPDKTDANQSTVKPTVATPKTTYVR